jgi:anti-sigma regulatory factor (Ser/Thr protein kinase)
MTALEASALANPQAISRVLDDVMGFLQREGVDARATHHVALVIDEIVANLGMHGGCYDKPARITVSVEPLRVRGEIIDQGPAFDPRSTPAPDPTAPFEERLVGGLGLHLVRQLSALEYSYQNGENRLTFFVARA